MGRNMSTFKIYKSMLLEGSEQRYEIIKDDFVIFVKENTKNSNVRIFKRNDVDFRFNISLKSDFDIIEIIELVWRYREANRDIQKLENFVSYDLDQDEIFDIKNMDKKLKSFNIPDAIID